MYRFSFTALFSLALLASPPVLAGTVRVVAPTGAPYANIQSAVDAAASGDVLLVKGGNYAGFTVGNKSLAIVAEAGQGVSVTDPCAVQGLGSVRTIVLQGLQLSTAGYQSTVLQLTNNVGHVRLVDCALNGSPYCSTTALSVSSCSDVVATGCDLRGSSAPPYVSPYHYTSGSAAVLSSSTVAVFDCTLVGGSAEDAPDGPGTYDGGNGGAGTSGSNLLLFASNCSLHGGDGGDAGDSGSLFNCSVGGNAGDGVFLTASSLARFLATSVSGGQPGAYSFSAGCSWDGGGGASLHGPPSSFVQLSGAARTFHVPSPVRESTSPTLRFHGLPDETVGLFVANAAAQRYLPSASGVLAVDAAPHGLMLHCGTIPASGVLQVPLPLGDLGVGVESIVLHLQPLFVAPDGSRRLGSPRVLVVLDSAF